MLALSRRRGPQLITLIDRCSSPIILSVSAEHGVTGHLVHLALSCLAPLPACHSAVDLIRLGGGRLRFLVAKSDLDVSEKISASSC